MLAQPVSLRAAVAGKLAARLLIVATLPALALASAPLTTDMTAAALVRLTLWAVAVLAYGCLWLGAAIIVDARGRAAPNNALVLAGLWLVFVLLVPAALNLAVRHAYPIPSRVEFATSVRAATRDAVVQGSKRLGRFLEDHPSSGVGVEGMQQYAMLQEARDQEIVRRMQPLQVRYESQLARQRAFVARAQYLSPAVVLHLALTDIAGTGDARHARFRTEVARFQEAWRAFFGPRLLAVSTLSPADYDDFPTFTYTEEPVSSVLRRAAAPISALAATGAALWVAGFWLYRRYELTR
jgi:ABC-2 type transport system permease protein